MTGTKRFTQNRSILEYMVHQLELEILNQGLGYELKGVLLFLGCTFFLRIKEGYRVYISSESRENHQNMC